MNDNELRHFGIKGMRWGVRRAAATTFEGKARTRQSQADRARGEQKQAAGLTSKAFNPKINARQRSADSASATAKSLRDSNHPKVASMFEKKAARRQDSANRARGDQKLATKIASKAFDPKINNRQRSADEAKRTAKALRAEDAKREKQAKLAIHAAKKAKLKEINAVRAKKKYDYAVNGAIIAGAGHVLIGTLSGRGFSVVGTAAVAAIGGGIGSAVGKRAPLGPDYQK